MWCKDRYNEIEYAEYVNIQIDDWLNDYNSNPSMLINLTIYDAKREIMKR